MKIAVLISGGVDSSLSLKLLADQGHDITAFYLKIWLEDEMNFLTDCPWEEDLKYVKSTCEMLNIPLEIISLQEEYHLKVVSYTIAEAKAGRTPNPDVLCNKFIKFGIFYDKISKDFEKVATGHYAQIEEENGIYKLKRSPDPIKDQTYFLCNLTQIQLSRAMFPIGHLTKNQVRQLAEKHSLPSKNRKDSQGICFLGKFKFIDFIKSHLGITRGKIIDFESNQILGEHDGHWFFTIGQREGIRLSGGPWFVVSKNSQENIVFVSNKYESIEKPRKSFLVSNFSWISTPNTQNANILVKIRHRSTPQKCSLQFLNDNTAEISLTSKDQGIAPGQFAAFYENDICIGSGIIL